MFLKFFRPKVLVFFGVLVFKSLLCTEHSRQAVCANFSIFLNAAAIDRDLHSQSKVLENFDCALMDFLNADPKETFGYQRLARQVLMSLLILSKSEGVLKKLEFYRKFRLLARNTITLLGFDSDFNDKFIKELDRQRFIFILKNYLKRTRNIGIFAVGSVIALGSLCGAVQKIETLLERVGLKDDKTSDSLKEKLKMRIE